MNLANDRFDWFPCNPGKLLGALQGMKPHVGYVYWIVCLRIYETGAPIRDTVDNLTRRTGVRKGLVIDALDELFASGKLIKTDAGITNPAADEVLADMRARKKLATDAGRAGAKGRWEKTERKQTPKDAPAIDRAEHSNAQLQGQIQLKKKEEPLPNGSGAAPGMFGAGDAAPKPKAKRPKAVRATMAESWKPSEADRAYAAAKGYLPPAIDAMGERCRDYHLAKATMIAGDVGLAATWRTWVNNQLRFAAERAQKASRGAPGNRTPFQILGGRPNNGN